MLSHPLCLRKALGSKPSVSITLLCGLGASLRRHARPSHSSAVSAQDDRSELVVSRAWSRVSCVSAGSAALIDLWSLLSDWAHGVVVSHPLRMRKALGSNPSVSIFPNRSTIPAPCFAMACACRSASAALRKLGTEAAVTPRTNFSRRQMHGIAICKGKQMGTWCSGITPA